MAGRGHRDIFASEIEWHDGTTDGTKYARFLLEEGDASSPMIILTKFDPGEVIEPHTHGTNYFEYIIQGEQTVGKVRFGTGDVRTAKAGTGYGPIKIGAEGCTVLIVFQEAAGAAIIPLGRARKLAEAAAA